MTIDGYTQSGASANTQPFGQGLNTVLRIQVTGGAGVGTCFTVQASDTTIKGLVMNGCTTSVDIQSGSNNRVEGNFMGTDPTGTQRLVDGGNQVFVGNAPSARVGGSTPAARNLITACGVAVEATGANNGAVIEGNVIGIAASGDVLLTPPCGGTTFPIVVNGPNGQVIRNVIAGGANGIFLQGSSGKVARGNYVGTDVTGTVVLGLSQSAMDVSGTNHVVGGSAPGDGNVLAGADFYQGLVLAGSGHVVQGNFIGTDVTGTLDLGNHRLGISATGTDITIGGTNPGEGNTIAFNGGSWWIQRRHQHLGTAGSSPRQPHLREQGQLERRPGDRPDRRRQFRGDAQRRGGRRRRLERPAELSDPHVRGAGPRRGRGDAHRRRPQQHGLDDLRHRLLRQPFLRVPPAGVPRGSGLHRVHPGDHQRLRQRLDRRDAAGFTVENGSRISATATDPAGNTSEFSQRLIFSMTPASGPPAGGTNVTITGMLFDDGATVSIGGQPATNVNVTGPTQITATTPALSAGSLNNVVVTNPNQTGGTLVNGWVTEFSDVPDSQQFYFHITKLVANAITVGCGTGVYCPLNSVTRQQMAVFLLKSKNGLCYVPPPCVGTFPDVPCSSNFAPWIEALAAAGITGGCGGGNYCPTNVVTRQQMAVFLLKTKHGSSYVPPVCSGDFADVPCPSQFADWIEQLAAEGDHRRLRRQQLLPGAGRPA